MQFFKAEDFEEATFLLYCWVMELLPTKDFGTHIRQYSIQTGSNLEYTAETREIFSEARAELFMHFDVVRLKLATFKAISRCLTRQHELEELFAGEGLPRDCADLYLYLQRDTHFWNEMRRKLLLFNDPVVLQDMELDPNRFHAQCYEDFERYHINRNIKFLVNKKLRFIANSNNESLNNFEQDIKARAVGYYYKVRPFRHRFHATNYAKSSVTGRVNQLIQFHKREENARLRDETGQWNNPGNSIVVSYNDVVNYDVEYGSAFS